MHVQAAMLSASTNRNSPETVRSSAEHLRRHDDPLHWEAPASFERTGALRDFRRFVSHLEQALGRKVDHEAYATSDEARFHGEIFLAGGPLRFSNFGRMVAFAEEHDAPEALMRTVEKLAAEHGYTLIARDDLAARYTGKHPNMDAGAAWFERFFG